MELLEDLLVPTIETMIINVQFVSPVDKSVTGELQARVQQPGPAKRSSLGIHTYR
jgi:hypothetical protein